MKRESRVIGGVGAVSSRRSFLRASVGAAAALAGLELGAATATAAASSVGATTGATFGGTLGATVGATAGAAVIDVHHHWYCLELLRSWGRDSIDPNWTTAASLATMDEGGVATAMLSITMPGIWKSADVAGSIKLARLCNEGMATTVRDHPGRFGFIAAIPLPEVDASLAEIDYALGTLKADGIGLLSSYEGHYPGEAQFAPVLEELNRRRALVYVHPMAPGCCTGLVPGMGAGALEAPTDTTRAVMSLLVTGTLSRLAEMRLLLGAGGGVLPFVGDRLVSSAAQAAHTLRESDRHLLSPESLRAALGRVYLDSAGVTNAADWAAILKFTTPSRLLYGSDFPFNAERTCLDQLRSMAQQFGLPADDLAAIEYGTARRLFPARFAARA
jgi:predicted TIM-barrel fold metal-dependent hydrolase